MITGELKNKINALWEIFWTGGITNPLDVVEQMTYLMFIHDLDATDNQRSKESAMLGLPYESMFGGSVRIGERTVPGSQLKWTTFRDFPAGKMYEYLLSKIATAGVNGQFRTPRHIIRMMVELVAPGPDEVICDPAYGTAGFLVEAGDYLRKHHKNEIFFLREKKATT